MSQPHLPVVSPIQTSHDLHKHSDGTGRTQEFRKNLQVLQKIKLIPTAPNLCISHRGHSQFLPVGTDSSASSNPLAVAYDCGALTCVAAMSSAFAQTR